MEITYSWISGEKRMARIVRMWRRTVNGGGKEDGGDGDGSAAAGTTAGGGGCMEDAGEAGAGGEIACCS